MRGHLLYEAYKTDNIRVEAKIKTSAKSKEKFVHFVLSLYNLVSKVLIDVEWQLSASRVLTFSVP
jgi:hypothetical protein